MSMLPDCAPLDPAQAKLVASALGTPAMVVEIAGDAFSVLAVDRLLRRFVIGAVHPAGPVPGELIGPGGFSMLGDAMVSARDQLEQQVLEVPIGDEPRWFEVSVTPIVDDGSCRQLLLTGAERTADHDVELRQRRSTRRFEAMVAHAPGLILLVDSAGRVLRASSAVERLLGLTADELEGRAIFELLHPDTLARSASMFNQILGQPATPITIDDFRIGRTDGTHLWCEATATNLLHDDDVAAIVFNAHDVTERRLAEERLELLATSDALTGLPNRHRLHRLLETSFAESARRSSRIGLVLVDIDDFKLVNDGFGHDVGDQVIRTVANRLQRLLDNHGVVGRIGGDEFALMVHDLRSDDQMDLVAEGVHELLRSPVKVGRHEIFVRASVGTTTGSPETADANSLLRSADLALYRAKRNGRNQTVSYTAELQLEAEERLTMITALQRALREGRLRLAYQPVVRHDGTLVGAEALLRWDHDGELLSPAAFLDLAEDTGLILPIGAWVIDQACHDLVELRSQVPGLAWVSVNLSSRQLLDQRLPLTMRRALDRHGLTEPDIAVEISEGTVRGDPAAGAVLAALGDVGVLLALDDLANDQLGLSRIDDLPVRAIKLDRPFVGQLDVDQDNQHRALAAAVLDLAAEHGIDVVAEGVETSAQAEILHDLGCPLFQGFLYAEPMDLGSFLTRY